MPPRSCRRRARSPTLPWVLVPMLALGRRRRRARASLLARLVVGRRGGSEGVGRRAARTHAHAKYDSSASSSPWRGRRMPPSRSSRRARARDPRGAKTLRGRRAVIDRDLARARARPAPRSCRGRRRPVTSRGGASPACRALRLPRARLPGASRLATEQPATATDGPPERGGAERAVSRSASGRSHTRSSKPSRGRRRRRPRSVLRGLPRFSLPSSFSRVDFLTRDRVQCRLRRPRRDSARVIFENRLLALRAVTTSVETSCP